MEPSTRVRPKTSWDYGTLKSVLPPAISFTVPSLQENLYANDQVFKSLYFCFLKIGLQLFKALQPALKDPEKQGLDAWCIYYKALKEMFKHFPKAVTLEIKMYAIWL